MSRWLRNEPTSTTRGSLPSFSAYDIVWAVAAGPLALVLRDPYYLYSATSYEVVTFSIVALFSTLLALQWFQLSAALTRFFSWSDAIDVMRAAAVSAALSAAIAFVIFRLDGLPRSLPLIHAMVLVIALGAGRGLSRLKSARRAEAGHAAGLARDHVLLVGATRLAWLYARLVDELPGSSRRIVGVVDERPRLTGRSIGRYAVVGVPGDLDTLLAEFRVHGVEVNRLVYAIDASALSAASVATMARVCSAQGVAIESVGEQLGVPAPQPLEQADEPLRAE